MEGYSLQVLLISIFLLGPVPLLNSCHIAMIFNKHLSQEKSLVEILRVSDLPLPFSSFRFQTKDKN